MTTRETAAWLGRSTWTIQRWVRQGRIDAVRLAGRIMVDVSTVAQLSQRPPEDVEEWLADQREGERW